MRWQDLGPSKVRSRWPACPFERETSDGCTGESRGGQWFQGVFEDIYI